MEVPDMICYKYCNDLSKFLMLNTSLYLNVCERESMGVTN